MARRKVRRPKAATQKLTTGPRARTPRQLLRHTIATLAYRAEKVLRDTPDGFAEFRLSPASRTPADIVRHLGDLMAWGERMARGEYRWQAQPAASWPAACEIFFRNLKALDAALARSGSRRFPAEVVFQGPIADSLTHVGQLALLRGAAGTPVRPESYARAQIRSGRVGREQSAKRVEFDGDASRLR
jgi:hypothetical protein